MEDSSKQQTSDMAKVIDNSGGDFLETIPPKDEKKQAAVDQAAAAAASKKETVTTDKDAAEDQATEPKKAKLNEEKEDTSSGGGDVDETEMINAEELDLFDFFNNDPNAQFYFNFDGEGYDGFDAFSGIHDG